jgi:hypothetical protein
MKGPAKLQEVPARHSSPRSLSGFPSYRER